METKPLLFGLVGFLLGGLLASVGGSAIHKRGASMQSEKGMTMSQMASSLQNKSGDEYDKLFLSEMIAHHEGAIDMAKLSASRAKHDEVKKLSVDIVTAQEKEIAEMKQWPVDWGYDGSMGNMHRGH